MNSVIARDAWTPQVVRGFLRAFGRAPSELRIEQLPSWWCNTVLRIESDDERLILRRYGITPADEVRWELAVLTHLAASGFPSIRPLARTDVAGEQLADFVGAPAILYPFIEGVSGAEVEWGRALQQTAATVARLHDLTERFEVAYPRSASGTESRRMIRQLVQGCTARGVDPSETALIDMLNRAERALRDFERTLESRGAGLRRGIVHHDAHLWNVLFRDGELVGLIDFDDAHEGFLVSDVAVMMTNWTSDPDPEVLLDLEKAARVVNAYERHRPLTDTERDLLPRFVLLHLLSGSASFVSGQVEQGMTSSEAIAECRQYRRFLRHVDNRDWMAGFRAAIGA